jgi:putative photosynthetic complex assembly protein 2
MSITTPLSDLLWPVAFAAFIWWFSTGIVLLLDQLPSRTFRWSMAVSTLLAGTGLVAIIKSASVDSVMASYVAFAGAVLLWGWHELAFLTGFMTGPRKTGCSADCASWAHFWHAIEAILYHELALIGTALLVVALTWQQPNQVGTWTFLALWLMRTSAKLNLFLGVRNLSEEFLPEHLAYLKSFFRKAGMNWLFPISITGGTLLVGVLVVRALHPGLSDGEVAGLMLVASFLALALVEHWMLVLPIDTTRLWRWAMQARRRRAAHEAGHGNRHLPQATILTTTTAANTAASCGTSATLKSSSGTSAAVATLAQVLLQPRLAPQPSALITPPLHEGRAE